MLTTAARMHEFIGCRPLRPAVPRSGVRLAVVVAFAVRLVVLLVVRNQIAQGEPVVRGNEVHARVRPPAVVFIEIRAAGEAAGEFAERATLPTPVVAYGVAIAPVPFTPTDGKIAHLVAARPDVPRFGDQLDAAQRRILVNDVEERRQPVNVEQLARERRGEVETEAVDVHLLDPVAQ